MSVYEPSGEYDPLAKLYLAEKRLIEAGARGEAVADALQEVRVSIGSLIHQRQGQTVEHEQQRQTR